MKIEFKLSAMAVIAGALALATMPRAAIAPSAWAEQNLVVPDGPRGGQKIDMTLTPYLREIVDFWSDDCPDNEASVRKSKQVGFTEAAKICTGYTIDVEPCDMSLIEPTDSNLTEFISLKLQPAIEASACLAAKVSAQVSRSGKGSTTFVKRFRGGTLLLGIATSTSDLRGKTRRKVIRDEASEYPDDLGGQGSPHDMIAGSYETFLAGGNWKNLAISTPVIQGACQITKEFEAGDRRFWFVKCPGCGYAVNFEIDHLKYNAAPPYAAHYVAPCCGTVIENHQKLGLMQTAEADGFGWIATAPGLGRPRSYHFDTLSSPFVPWDVVAKREVESRDDPAKRKTFDNLTLGIAHEVKGDAPDRDRLMTLRESDLLRRQIPPRALLVTGAADVQGNGIYYEIVGYAHDRQSYVIDADFLAGETTDHTSGAFEKLAEVYERKYPDAFGGERGVDAFGIDSGFRSHVVYAFTRLRPNAFALKGMDGWSRPPLGTPSTVDLDMGGRKIRGATVWAVGTWSLKAQFYADLGKQRLVEGAPCEPAGACHFGMWQDPIYFEQITAEYLGEEQFKGRSRRVWKESRSDWNHFLDCRVYNLALADYLGVSRMTQDEWARLAGMRGTPIELTRPDMFAPEPVKIADAANVGAPAPAAKPVDMFAALASLNKGVM